MTIEIKVRDAEARSWLAYLQTRYNTRSKDLQKLIKYAVRLEVAAQTKEELQKLLTLENQ